MGHEVLPHVPSHKSPIYSFRKYTTSQAAVEHSLDRH